MKQDYRQHYFFAQVEQYYPQGAKFLVALSGGMDSCVLLSLMRKLREENPHFSLRAIHVHHGLSSHAQDWVQFCQRLCANYQIPLLVEYVQVDRKQGVEASARLARYQAIQRQRQTDEIIVTAHHQCDQTETFFLALKRGSGIQGLGAMQTQGQLFSMPIFRPLLGLHRSELLSYAQMEKLEWVEDESNQDDHYERNFLRNQVLPLLRQRWSHFDRAVQRSAQHCFDQQQLLQELLSEEFAQIYNSATGALDISYFAQRSVLQQRALLRQWLAELGALMPSLIQLNHLLQEVIFASVDANPQFRLGKQCVRRYKQHLYLTPIWADVSQFRAQLLPNQELVLPDELGTLQMREVDNQFLFHWQNSSQNILLTLPRTTQPVQISFKYSGTLDLHANGLQQDIKKIWQRFNIPPWQRQRIPLISYGTELQAALGVFQVNTILN